MDKFLYANNIETRDNLLTLGYHLISSDDWNQIYVFENKKDLNFDHKDLQVVPSNTLMF